MEFTLTDEQRQVQRAAREFFETEVTVDYARRQIDGEDAATDELWAMLCELDYPAVAVPPEFDGLGEDVLYATLLLEESGRVAMPGPFPETAVFATSILADVGSEAQKRELLPAIADGEVTFSFALYEGADQQLPHDVQVAAERDGDEYVLSGEKILVPYGGSVDRVIVAARTGTGRSFDGITLFSVDPEAVAVRRRDALDETRPVFDLGFDDHRVPVEDRIGPEDAGGDALREAMDRYQTALCGMMVGAADRVVETSAEYAKERVAFGHPIGRFQAVKHRIVDMWMDVQAGRSLVYHAAWALSNDRSEAPVSVSSAKSFCGERFPPLMKDDIQNHGAMGVTWDHDTHIFMKQAKSFEHFLGSPGQHRERIADAW